MPLTIGVDMVERSNKTKATKKSIVNGVAGRSIVKWFLTRAVIWLSGRVMLLQSRGVFAPQRGFEY